MNLSGRGVTRFADSSGAVAVCVMDLQLFFDNFDVIAAAPNGVRKLRELILQLAVRGKLVPQDAADEPAGKLLERIRVKAEKLIKDKKIKTDHDLLIIKESEPSYKVPQTWAWTRLGAIVDYNGSSKVTPESIPEHSWLLELEDIEKDTSRILQRLTFKDRDSKSNKAEFQKGDVLYGKLRPYLNKVVIADENGFCTTEIIPLRVHLGVMPEYLMTVLKSRDFIDYVNSKTYGVKMPRLGTEDGRRALIPLPPVEEQKRIVAKVDELMKLCDTLETQQQQNRSHLTQMQKSAIGQLLSAPDANAFGQHWQDIVENFELLFDDVGAIDDLRQAILQLAVQGKLVRQDSGDEPAEKLLSRIAENNSQGKLRSRAIAPVVEIATLPELPEQWTWAKFPELGEFGRGKSKHRPRNDPSLYKDGRYPLVQTGDVARSSGSISTYTNVYNDVGLAQSKLWKKGTLCITIAANIADTGILEFDSCFPDSVVGFVPSPEISDSQYFMYFMRTAKEHLLSYAPATAQKNINLGILEEVMIPLPPVEEIHRIVAKVNQLMTLCDTLQTHLTQRQQSAIDLAEVAVGQIADRVG
jgi:type I restriction enzyme, S subunit